MKINIKEVIIIILLSVFCGLIRYFLLDDDFCDKHHPDVYLVNRGIHAEIEALRLTRILRSEKFSVELDN